MEADDQDRIGSSLNWRLLRPLQNFNPPSLPPSPLLSSWASPICVLAMKHPQSNLPPGFRFHPTDHELIVHYLSKKVASLPLPVSLIADVDIYKFDPWDLPGKAAFGEKEWYFFSPRDRKYPNGARPNRAAGSGYWKATGTDKNIASAASQNTIVGFKKALVFYRGKPPKGVKTNWIMHEYRLAHSTTKPIKLRDTSMRLDDWVLCRIYNKSKHHTSSSSTPEAPSMVADDRAQDHQQLLKQALLPASTSSTAMNAHLPPHHTTTLASNKSLSFSNLLDAMDYSLLSSILSDQGQNCSNPTALASVKGAVGGGNIPDHHLTVPSAPDMEHCRPKRQLPNVNEEALYPSKKSQLSSCSFPEPSNDHQYENSNPQYWNFLHRQQLLSQQLLLGPHPRFQQ